MALWASENRKPWRTTLEIRLLSKKDANATLVSLTRHATRMYWAVAWATKNPVAREAAKHQSKLKHLVIGTHFYQTDPDVLEQFSNLSAAAVRPPTGAL